MGDSKKRFGIYGGAFSPIHSGHVKAALAFINAMNLDKLLVIPAAKPPHKPQIAEATVEERMEMARLAFENTEEYKNGKIEISDFEAKNSEKSYTVLTLEHFSSSDRKLFLLVGTDVFLILGKWYRAKDIFSISDIVLMRREEGMENLPLIQQKKDEYAEKFGARVHEIAEPPIVVSSTEIREDLKWGSGREILIPDAVVKYIKENNLYN